MGGWTSVFWTNSPEQEEEEQKIKKYEEHVEKSPYAVGLEDTDDLKEIKLWQRFIYDMRFRVSYAVVICILLGLVLPFVVYLIWFDNTDTTIYGSCLIKPDARFQCLINNAEPATREACVDANCCFEENESLPFKCFHSLPSAYQYRVSDIKQGNDSVQLDMTPNHKDLMSSLRILISWVDDTHINLQIFDPSKYPNRQIFSSNEMKNEENGIPVGGNVRGDIAKNSLIISYGDMDGYTFVQIVRQDEITMNNETIFDTRLGPITSGPYNDFIYFTTVLPTPYFYGLKGGEGISSRGHVTYGAVNGFESSELPFYMSLEESGSWHGVLLDTTFPFLVQVLQAPGIAFHIEGPNADVNLHLFTGPSKTDIMQQLHSHILTKLEVVTPPRPPKPYLPPYWGLGLHLCRKSYNGSRALSQIQELNEPVSENATIRRIPYDSDCIDEDLRNPFAIDHENFSEEELAKILQILMDESGKKKIVLAQKVTLPSNNTGTEFQDYLVMDPSNMKPFEGLIDGTKIHYFDVFHPNASNPFTNISKIPYDGLVLLDNFPKNEKAIDSCKSSKAESYLQKLLLESSASTWISESNVQKWGSICPNLIHNVGAGKERHFHLHNIYGLEAMKKFRQIAESDNTAKEMMIFSSSSGWTESLYLSGHSGMEVAFSWIGLRESLAHVLRNFILSPLASTPICGSYLPNEIPVDDSDLCLRWYQVALLLPFAYHSYAHGNVSRGPLDFSQRNQDYLKEAILQRYTYAPYYYTLLVQYQETLVPPILPMSYGHHPKDDRSTVFKLVDQFMIGEAILAAPIVTPGLNRETYFPPGIWYDVDGYLAWNDFSQGGFKMVTGHKTQTPLFIKGGHILPILENPEGNSIMESRAGNYTLLVGLNLGSISIGQFYPDVGIQKLPSTENRLEFTVSTRLNPSSIEINMEIVARHVCDDSGDNANLSTMVDQVKLLGFPIIYDNENIEITQSDRLEQPLITPRDEIDYLRIYGLNIDWCKENSSSIRIVASIG